MADIPLNKKDLSYYKTPNKISYEILNSITTQLRFYIAETLYKHEIDYADYDNSVIDLVKNRVVPSNVDGLAAMGESAKTGAGNTDPNLTNIDYFSNVPFPFTAYNLGEVSEVDEESKNTSASMGRVYIDEFNSYCSIIPVIQTFEFTSFFTTFNDYDEAVIRFLKDLAALSRASYPLNINGNIYTFEFDIGFELAKGEYTSDFESYLDVNNIYDLVHNVEIKYNLFIPSVDVGVYPITDMRVYLIRNDIDSLVVNEAVLSNVNNAFSFTTNFDSVTPHTRTDPLIFTFDIAIVESSFIDNLSIDPELLYRVDMTPDCLVFTVYPFGGQFEANTTYTVSIPKMKLRSESGFYYKTDYEATFTTGA